MPDEPQTRSAQTGLDDAMRRMAAAPDETTARLTFHAELSRAELFVLLDAEISGDRMRPRVFDLSDGRAVLAFGSEMQLADFAGDAAAYAALPGRVLVSMLAAGAEPLSLLIGPDVDHAALLDPAALRWLDQTLSAPPPDEAQATPERFTAPDLPGSVLSLLIPALERRLSGLPGLEIGYSGGCSMAGWGARACVGPDRFARKRAGPHRPRRGRGPLAVRAGGRGAGCGLSARRLDAGDCRRGPCPDACALCHARGADHFAQRSARRQSRP
ncbi:SseB family protein [Pararhodobacter sp.]|uniref:SseB family protein n=1 Tax=Pararhodobacter sp. TaxID=2127056 RepID=UPI002AFFFAC9|nr:SseB family protein [Pararhodobacter sp.]